MISDVEVISANAKVKAGPIRDIAKRSQKISSTQR
jgi:hypothetical protein